VNHFRTLVAAAALALTGGMAQAQSLSLEGGGAASLTGIVPQTYAQFAAEADISLQVVLGQTLTRAALKLAAGRIDMAPCSPSRRAHSIRSPGPMVVSKAGMIWQASESISDHPPGPRVRRSSR